MSNNPKVTVLMPVYNSEKYLREAIQSILDQSYRDFEFLIINDGSTDSSREIIKSYTDNRIHLVDNEKNLGLIASLNRGLQIAQSEYIVRMDADDISLPNRIKLQVAFMNKNPDIGISGGRYILMKGYRKILINVPLESERLSCELLFTTPICHPSIILRKECLTQNNLSYPDMLFAEDYGLWVKAFKSVKMANIKDVLLLDRVHQKQISTQHYSIQIGNTALIKRELLAKLDISLSERELTDLVLVNTSNFSITNTSLKDRESLFLKLISINKEKQIFSEKLFSEVVSKYWGISCFNFAKKGYFVWKEFFSSQLTNKAHYSVIFHLKLILGFLLRPGSWILKP